MRLSVNARLDYRFEEPTDVLLQLEVARIADQAIASENLRIEECGTDGLIAAQDGIGLRRWLRPKGRLVVEYNAEVMVSRASIDCGSLDEVDLCALPADTVQYLMASRYCPADRFGRFVEETFGDLRGGRRILAMRDWVQNEIAYSRGSSSSETTAADTFVAREGVCRDFAHLLVSFARAAGIPARVTSVYALGVEPPDFHAVTEVFLGGAWHLVDATGMASPDGMAKIGVGRDAADIAFLTAFGEAKMNEQSVTVEPA